MAAGQQPRSADGLGEPGVNSIRRFCFLLLTVFVFTLPWQSAISLGGSRTVSSFIGIAAILVGVLAIIAGGRIRRPPAFFGVMAVYAAWQLVTFFWSIDQSSTLFRVLTVFQLVAMVWLVLEFADTETHRQRLMQAFVWGCVVVVLVLVQAYASGESVDSYRFAPADFNVNETADTLALGLVMALYLLSYGKGALRLWINFTYIPLAVLAVVLTASRSGFVATCLALLATFFVLGRVKRSYRVVWSVVIVGVFSAVFFAVTLSTDLNKNVERITFSADTATLGTLTGRTNIWAAGKNVFLEHPIAGVGAGTFGLAVQEQMGEPKAPHNLYVATATEMGLIGLVLLASLLVAAFAPAVVIRHSRQGIMLIMVAVLLAVSMVANVHVSKVFWLVLALMSLGYGDRLRMQPHALQTSEAQHPALAGREVAS